jgi:hypothetical protein
MSNHVSNPSIDSVSKMQLQKTLFIATCLGALFLGSQSSFAATFGDDYYSSWAETPRGRFECRDDKSTEYRQTITLGGTLVFREIPGPRSLGGPTLSDGIKNESTGCPEIIANQNGYLVIKRAVQPPHYGVMGYAIINFNDPKFLLTELGQGQYPEDEKISASKRLKWSATGLTLQFVGYLADEQAASADSPPSKLHKVRFNFNKQAAEIVK